MTILQLTGFLPRKSQDLIITFFDFLLGGLSSCFILLGISLIYVTRGLW